MTHRDCSSRDKVIGMGRYAWLIAVEVAWILGAIATGMPRATAIAFGAFALFLILLDSERRA